MVFVFVYVFLSCQDLIMYKYVLQLPIYICSTGIYNSLLFSSFSLFSSLASIVSYSFFLVLSITSIPLFILLSFCRYFTFYPSKITFLVRTRSTYILPVLDLISIFWDFSGYVVGRHVFDGWTINFTSLYSFT